MRTDSAPKGALSYPSIGSLGSMFAAVADRIARIVIVAVVALVVFSARIMLDTEVYAALFR